MGRFSKLLKMFRDPFPSFDELRERHHADALTLSKDEARQRIGAHPLLSPPEAAHIRAQILSCLDDSFDQPMRDQCDALVHKAIEVTGYLVRPGNVEELWYLDGLLDRLLAP